MSSAANMTHVNMTNHSDMGMASNLLLDGASSVRGPLPPMWFFTSHCTEWAIAPKVC